MYKADSKLRELQLHSLDILLKLDKIFKKYGINYSLVGGSAIGAIVHNGFIPWDDDIDICLDRINYNKFLKINDLIRQENLELINYSLTDTNHSAVIRTLISKVESRTYEITYVSQYNEKINSGIFIDVTCFDRVHPNRLKRKIQLFFSDLATLSINNFPAQNRGKLIKILTSVFFKITTKGIRLKICKFCESQFSKYLNHKDFELSELMFTRVNRINFPPELFNEFIEVDFENQKLPVFKKYHDYLTARYSENYTKIPPKSERHPHHNIIDMKIKS